MVSPMPGTGGSTPLKVPGSILRAGVANTTIMTQTPPVATVMTTTLTAVGSKLSVHCCVIPLIFVEGGIHFLKEFGK